MSANANVRDARARLQTDACQQSLNILEGRNVKGRKGKLAAFGDANVQRPLHRRVQIVARFAITI
jgi:hypothetical protein